MDNQNVASLIFNSSLTNLCETNTSFDTGVLRICYTGKNRNGSYIAKEDIVRNLNTIYNCPVVCNYDRVSDTLGGHDIEVVADKSGMVNIVNLTQPVGVIPESANTWFEEFTEPDGSVHEYLYADVLLWKRQEAYKKIRNDGVVSHSMEITVKDGESVDGVYHIRDFEFTAFALIGVEPCFESSSLEMFSASDFKAQYAQMMRELKEEYTTVITDNTGNDKEDFAKGGNENMEQNIETGIIGEEAVMDPVADGVESTAEFSVNEENNAVNEDNNGDAVEVEEAESFNLSSAVESELINKLSENTFVNRWGEKCRKYYFMDYDPAECLVFFEDAEDKFNLYGCNYVMNGDAVEIDFATAKRKKWVIADFNTEDDEAIPMSAVYDLLGKAEEDYADILEMFNSKVDEVNSITAEVEELRAYKSATEKAAEDCKKNELFAQFGDLAGNEAFESLKEASDDFDVETIEEKCYAIRGRCAAVANFAVQSATPKIRVEKSADIFEENNEPYGGLFAKYRAH